MIVTTHKISAAVSRRWCIAQVSDLHDRNPRPVLDALAAQPPDIIAVTGDLFNRLADATYALPFLKEAAAIAPTFYAPGNHEWLEEGDEERIAATGAVFLCDRAVTFQELTVGGLCSGFRRERQGNCKRTPPPDTAFLADFAGQPGFKLLLCHHPEYYPTYIRQLPIDLTLSGHAHGGQWQVFGRGIFAPGQGLFPRYTGGVYENRLVVSRGLSNTAPAPRFGNPTELVYILLDK
ncbi:MAG: metallophosphoesterase [Clostridia bacterium]|nr:metallophosphoesterase [Clostridia bacterium]